MKIQAAGNVNAQSLREITLRQALAFPGKRRLRFKVSRERMNSYRGLNLVPCAHQSM